MVIIWYGHATFVIQTAGKTIYIDPYADDPQEKADVILISHSHFDHSKSENIIKARTAHTRILTSIENVANIAGAEPVEAGDITQIGEESYYAVEAYTISKFRSPGIPFHPKGFGLGWIIEAEGKRIYHAGDTDVISEMGELGRIDVALLPIGGIYTMSWQEAVEAVKIIKPKQVIPMHYNTPTIGIEADPKDFQESVEAQTKAGVVIMYPGQSIVL